MFKDITGPNLIRPLETTTLIKVIKIHIQVKEVQININMIVAHHITMVTVQEIKGDIKSYKYFLWEDHV